MRLSGLAAAPDSNDSDTNDDQKPDIAPEQTPPISILWILTPIAVGGLIISCFVAIIISKSKRKKV